MDSGTPSQSAHADVGLEHDDVVARWLPGGRTLAILWSTDPTCPRRIDLLVDKDGVLVTCGQMQGCASPDGLHWTTVELQCGDALVFHAQGIHGGGCNHVQDGTPPPDQVCTYMYHCSCMMKACVGYWF